MNLKLYVGNLAFGASEEDLKKLFSEAGAVQSVKIVTDSYSGRSRGFGFVEMLDQNEAQAAIQNLNGKELLGQQMNVNEARPRTDRGRSGGQGGHRGRSGYGNKNRY